MIVVSDASPINYLVQIGHIDVLPLLFKRVILSTAVLKELAHERSPQSVKVWARELPSWCEVSEVSENQDPELAHLDSGERASIQLALELKADYLLIDERLGREAASAKQLQMMGVLGVLRRAEQQGFLNLHNAVQRLTPTNFRMSARLRAEFLSEDGSNGRATPPERTR